MVEKTSFRPGNPLDITSIESRCWAVGAHVASHRRDDSVCPNDLTILGQTLDDLVAILECIQEATPWLDVVLTRGPGPESDFVELEDAEGCSTVKGQWVNRGDGYAVLRIYLGFPDCDPLLDDDLDDDTRVDILPSPSSVRSQTLPIGLFSLPPVRRWWKSFWRSKRMGGIV